MLYSFLCVLVINGHTPRLDALAMALIFYRKGLILFCVM